MKILKFLVPLLQILSISLILGTIFWIVKSSQNPEEKVFRKTNHFSKTLFVDPSLFSEKEIEYIEEAAKDWNEATNHIVEFKVKLLPQEILDFRAGILIMKVNEFHPDILVLDSVFGIGNTLGFFAKDHPVPHILLVGRRVHDRNFKVVLEHELGHALGLQHDVGIEGMNTLMNPGEEFSSDHITRRDLDRFCKLFGCDSKELHKNAPDE